MILGIDGDPASWPTVHIKCSGAQTSQPLRWNACDSISHHETDLGTPITETRSVDAVDQLLDTSIGFPITVAIDIC